MSDIGTARGRFRVVGFLACLACLLIAAGALTANPSSSNEPTWLSADPNFEWEFPRDHWAHRDFRTEWWYFTGHLQSKTDPARRFGYQFTFFRVGIADERSRLESAWSTEQLVMGHASITDIAEEEHYFTEVLYREIPMLAGFSDPPDPRIAWSRGPTGTADLWELGWNGTGFDFRASDDRQGLAFDLHTRAIKPRIFQGPNGFSKKGREDSAASLYYSFTRLETEGVVTIGDVEFSVSGESWMDKEFGSNQLGSDQVGWDWFSLQLDDGRELMLYLLRKQDGTTDFSRGTLVDDEGSAFYLDGTDWQVEAQARWKSVRTNAEYPAEWRIRVPEEGMDLVVTPLLKSQENVAVRSGGIYYWEGAVDVSSLDGRRLGHGYVELTGYGKGNRPPI